MDLTPPEKLIGRSSSVATIRTPVKEPGEVNKPLGGSSPWAVVDEVRKGPIGNWLALGRRPSIALNWCAFYRAEVDLSVSLPACIGTPVGLSHVDFIEIPFQMT